MILAQNCPASANDVLLFTAKVRTDVSALRIANLTGGGLNFRVRLSRPTEEVANNRQYLNFGTVIALNASVTDTQIGVMYPGESVYVLASAANSLAFTLLGEERP